MIGLRACCACDSGFRHLFRNACDRRFRRGCRLVPIARSASSCLPELAVESRRLRDVGSFTARSETLGSLEDTSNARLVLTNGPNRIEAAGAVTRDRDSGESVFDSDVDIDGAKGKALARQLMPVLEGRSDIELAIMLATGPAAAVSRSIPLKGLAPLLDRFRTVCFK